jgi:hypothetical protein
MNLNINISLRPELKPLQDGKKISYSNARNLPIPHNMEHATHKVRKGETLATIAQQYDLNAVELSEFLRETEGNDYIAEGQEIKIPTQLKEI